MIDCTLKTAISAVPAAALAELARRSSRPRVPVLLALSIVAWSMMPSYAGAAFPKLSDAGQATSDIDFVSSKARPRLSPNGLYAVYAQDRDTDGAFELFSVRLDGTASPVRLSAGDLSSGSQHIFFAISPDSSRVVYLSDQERLGTIELFSVPIDGGGSVKLHPDLSPPRYVLDCVISPDPLDPNPRVFFSGALGTDPLMFQLYSVPIDGSESMVQLNADLLYDRDVVGYKVDPSGERVVYRQGWDSSGYFDLWSVPVGGPKDAAVRISRSFVSGGAADPVFQFGRQGGQARVVYRADATNDGTFNLYSVPILGGTSTQLNGALGAGEDVSTGFLVNADGDTVVYRSDERVNDVFELYSTPIGQSSPTRLNGPILGSGRNVSTGFQISADSDTDTVVYISDEELDEVFELYSVPMTGGPTKISGAVMDAGSDVLSFSISPNSERVVYLADQELNAVNELYSVPIDGSLSEVNLNPTLFNGGDVQSYRISPDSRWVVYGADQVVDTNDELFAQRIDGSGDNLRVSRALGFNRDVVLLADAWLISSNDLSLEVVYAADGDVDEKIELYVSGPPRAPRVVAAAFDETATLTIVWDNPADIGGSPITDYAVDVISSPNTPQAQVEDNGCPQCASRLISNLVNGRAYTFKVRAINSHGAGAYSAESNEVTPGPVASVPGAPTGVGATPWLGSAEVTFIAPSSDGGSPITGYTVTPSPAPAGWSDANAGSTALTHLIAGLQNDTPYTFRVVAHNLVGNSLPSDPSDPAVAPGCVSHLDDEVIFCGDFVQGDTTGWSFELTRR